MTQAISTYGFVPEHLYFTSEFERALALNGAMLGLFYESEGIKGKLPWSEMTMLRNATLADLAEASRLVDVYDKRPQQHGARTVHFKCDDRLIAAIYTFLHYALPPARHQFEDDRMILRCDAGGGHIAFLICGSRDARSMADTGDDAEED